MRARAPQHGHERGQLCPTLASAGARRTRTPAQSAGERDSLTLVKVEAPAHQDHVLARELAEHQLAAVAGDCGASQREGRGRTKPQGLAHAEGEAARAPSGPGAPETDPPVLRGNSGMSS